MYRQESIRVERLTTRAADTLVFQLQIKTSYLRGVFGGYSSTALLSSWTDSKIP